MNKLPPVIPAPEWLKERTRRLRALPPPTLEEVRTAWAASANAKTQIELDIEDKIRRGIPIR